MHPDNTVIEQSIEKATWGLFRICRVKTISSFLLAYSTTYCIIPKGGSEQKLVLPNIPRFC